VRSNYRRRAVLVFRRRIVIRGLVNKTASHALSSNCRAFGGQAVDDASISISSLAQRAGFCLARPLLPVCRLATSMLFGLLGLSESMKAL
jgi:hypothetical protein